jgi:uncharacterized protein YndB with AHSA1/START domain
MTESRITREVTRRFDAAAERVYDAFLDPAWAGRFLFATPTGQVVRCEIEPRVGGRFVIVDRRGGEDVEHTGTYLELERPRRIVFTFSVAKYAVDADRVTIDITALDHGCELRLRHDTRAADAAATRRTEAGWAAILDVAAQLVVDAPPSCGAGVAQHAAIPARVGIMFEGLAETLELHLKMLVLDDPDARREAEVYRTLASGWRDIARRVGETAALMAAQRELPMGRHDDSGWDDTNLQAFEKFVKAEGELLSLLKVAAEHDEKTLASMKEPATE